MILCVSFSETEFGICIYHLVVRLDFNLLPNSNWTPFPCVSSLVFCYYCTSLLDSLITWLIVSSLSPSNLYIPFSCLLESFPICVCWWSFTEVCDSRSLLVSRTLLSILADLNNVAVWMVSTRPLISKSSRPFSNPLVTVFIIIVIIIWKFITPMLADGFSLESEWQ